MLGWAEVALDHCELSSSWASPFLGWQSHSAIKRSISVCWAIERFRVGAEGSTLSPWGRYFGLGNEAKKP